MANDAKLVHVKVYVSGVFNAKVADVWEIVRNYGQAETWLTGPQGVKTFTRLLVRFNCFQTILPSATSGRGRKTG